MADESKEIYDMVPDDEAGGDRPVEDDSAPETPTEESSSSVPTEGDTADVIPMEPLLDAFDDDEDLESDPEVEEVLSGKKAKKAARNKDDDSPGGDSGKKGTLVKDCWDPPKAMFIAGGILTVAAIVATAIYTPEHRFLAPLLVLYKVGVHTGTGVVAVIVASMLLHMKTGRLDKAASRIFVAISAFMLVAHFELGIGTLSQSVQILLGSFVYLVLIAWLFRLRRDRLLVVTIAHLALVALMELGMVLSTSARIMVPGLIG